MQATAGPPISPRKRSYRIRFSDASEIRGFVRQALLLQEGARTHRKTLAAFVAASIVAAIGALTLVQYVSGWSLGIDQALFSEDVAAVATSHPGRMAPNTALCFLLIGISLLLVDVETKRGFRPAEAMWLAVGCIGFMALTGYLYRVPALHGPVGNLTHMALHTALAFVAVPAAGLCSRPDRGWMAMVTSEGVGGVLVRWMLPAVAGILVLLEIGRAHV